MILTKEQYAQFRNEIATALSAIAQKYNCEVEVGNIEYSDILTEAKLLFKSKGEQGESAEMVNFKTYCSCFGFKPEDYGRKVVIRNKEYTFVGFNPKARKNYCIISANGTNFVTTPKMVVEGMQ